MSAASASKSQITSTKAILQNRGLAAMIDSFVGKKISEEVVDDPKTTKLIEYKSRIAWSKAKNWDDVLNLGTMVAKGLIRPPYYLELLTFDPAQPDLDLLMLAEINKLGLLTTNSQSGESMDVKGSLQKAYLIALGRQNLVTIIAEVMNKISGFACFVTTLGSNPCVYDFYVTYDWGEPFSTVGFIDETLTFIEEWNPNLVKTLRKEEKLFSLTIVDTIIGRNILLPELLKILRSIKNKEKNNLFKGIDMQHKI